jgi:16S rRNA (adenine1518-N6/adenine1519-N6)-dimethyltransferase
MKPTKKRFGQHFLRDTGILGRLERLIEPVKGDCVIEIGAGDGALSARIAPLVSRYLAIEIDADQMADLRAVLAPWPHATAIQGDILNLDLHSLLSGANHEALRPRIIGNLPYNVATAIIQNSLRLQAHVSDMVYMVQLEVAERIIAPPGSRTYGYLSIDCQHRADVRLAFKVPPACFVPRPRVMSAVVTFRPRGIDPGSKMDLCFDNLVKAAFAYRRKTVLNSLRRHPEFGPVAEKMLAEAGIADKRRAEEITIAEYRRLALIHFLLLKSATEGA